MSRGGKHPLANLVDHHLASFRQMLSTLLPAFFRSVCIEATAGGGAGGGAAGVYRLEFVVDEATYLANPTFNQFGLGPRHLSAHEARKEGHTPKFALRLGIKLTFTPAGGKAVEFPVEDISFGGIPAMVGSWECDPTHESDLDFGGYMMTNGNEKVFMCTEHVANNMILSFVNKNKSTTPKTKMFPALKYSHVAELKSLPMDRPAASPKKLELYISNEGAIHACIPTGKGEAKIPVCLLLRALGMDSDLTIAAAVWPEPGGPAAVPDERIFLSMREGSAGVIDDAETSFQTKLNATITSGHHGVTAAYVLEHDVLPNTPNRLAKAWTIARMIRRLLDVSAGRRPADDRDSYANKRIMLPGVALFSKYKTEFQQQVVKHVRAKLAAAKSPEAALKDVRAVLEKRKDVVDKNVQSAINNGNFVGDSSTTGTKATMTQPLKRTSFADTLDQLTKTQAPVERMAKLVAPRHIHGSQWGYVCPVATPEADTVGIVKNFAIGAAITLDTSPAPAQFRIQNFLEEGPLRCLEEDEAFVYLNGSLLGIVKKPAEVVAALKVDKFTGVLDPFTTIAWNVADFVVEVQTDGGRLVRPLIRAEALKRLSRTEMDRMSFGQLLREAVEYVSPLEADTALVAVNAGVVAAGHTHAEIHPMLLYCFMANLIPFMWHNQSPRNSYSTTMWKQQMGMFVTKPHLRWDRVSYGIFYPERPLVGTAAQEVLGVYRMRACLNVSVAVMTLTGQGIEDALLINQGFLARAGFLGTVSSCFKEEIMHIDKEKFGNPTALMAGVRYPERYHAIQEDGTPKRGAILRPGDCMIGKVLDIKGPMPRMQNMSHFWNGSEDVRVDDVVHHRSSSQSGSANKYIRVRVVALRVPIIGDKFASAHSQKGTLGQIVPEADMPFDANGNVPDLILNPHAIPSRMTGGQQFESVAAKIGAHVGAYGDGTVGSELSVEDLVALSRSCGWGPHATCLMTDGRTGLQMPAAVFVGRVAYSRLKHMVLDKSHARSRGAVNMLTRQPTEGRSKDGGLRVGEMERDCLLGYGGAGMLTHHLMDLSDGVSVVVCQWCSRPSETYRGRGVCRRCPDNRADFVRVTIPYGAKLLWQEVEGLHVVPQFITS